jgi:hypothetical protein
MEENMAKERHVDKLMSVFSIMIGKDLGLPENVSTQVVFVYNRKENVRKFNLIDKEMNEDMTRRITSWLEKNVDVHDVIHGLKSKGVGLR